MGMETENSWISLRRKNVRTTVIVVNTDTMKQFIKRFIHRRIGPLVRGGNQVFAGLDFLASFKSVLLVWAGLGLGIGLGIGLFSQPPRTEAFPSPLILPEDGIKPHRVHIPQLGYHLKVVAPNATINSQSRGLGQSGPTIIEGGAALATLNDAQLGQQIEVEATNNGVYRYSIIEIREVVHFDATQFMATSQPTLLLVVSNGLVSPNSLVIIAREQ